MQKYERERGERRFGGGGGGFAADQTFPGKDQWRVRVGPERNGDARKGGGNSSKGFHAFVTGFGFEPPQKKRLPGENPSFSAKEMLASQLGGPVKIKISNRGAPGVNVEE